MNKKIFTKKIVSISLALTFAFSLMPTNVVKAGNQMGDTISAGALHSLVIKEDGTLWSFGDNMWGQLGDGNINDLYNDYTRPYKNAPVKIMDDVKNVSAGSSHSLVLKEDGTLWSFGLNVWGQLGDGTGQFGDGIGEPPHKNVPVKIMDDVKSISTVGLHSLVIKEDGTLWGFGRNLEGQLGDGTNEDKNAPVKIMDDVKSVSAGVNHSLVIKEDGSLWSFGNNSYGQLGDGNINDLYNQNNIPHKSAPVKIMDAVKSVSAGPFHSLVIKEDDTLWSFGDNSYGQLGDGTNDDKNVPVKIMDGIKSASAGGYHSLVIKEDNTLWTFGLNETGELGDGNINDLYNNEYGRSYKNVPVKIMDEVNSVSAGSSHNLVLKEDGTLWSFGLNVYGQLGDGNINDLLYNEEVPYKSTPNKIMDGVLLQNGTPLPLQTTIQK